MIAVALIVIDVDTRSSGMPSKSAAMSSIESIATPTRPTSPAASAVVRVVAHLRGQIEGDAEAADALRQEVAIPGVRFGGRAKAGVLAHRPQPAAIHRRLDAARVGKHARQARRRVRQGRGRPARAKRHAFTADSKCALTRGLSFDRVNT